MPDTWQDQLEWADGEVPDGYAHDPAWVAAHTGDDGYFGLARAEEDLGIAHEEEEPAPDEAGE